jgi:hypothetical protein
MMEPQGRGVALTDKVSSSAVMAASFVNYQLRTNDTDAVVRALEQIIASSAFVSSPKDGWVTIYDEASDAQDQAEIDRVAHDLSLQLHAPLLTFLVHNSNLLVYYLFDDEGCLIDEFNSAPEYFGQIVSEEARARFGGQAIALQPYCKQGISQAEIETVLRSARGATEGGFALTVPAEQRLARLAALLGIDSQRAIFGYNLFNKSLTALAEGRDFVKVQTRRRRPNPRNQVLPRIPPKK